MALDETQTEYQEDSGENLPEDSIRVAVESHEVRKLLTLSRYARNFTQAHMALLDNEVLTSTGDVEAFRLVRMHFADLERWHETHTGWRIQRTSSFFRLERHPYGITPVAFDEKLKKPRDFACLVWLLWFAEKRYLAGGGRNQQFLLSQLADEIQEQSRLTEAGYALDFRNQQDRYSIWRALDYLTRQGGVQTIEGDARRWVDDAEQADNEVLYEFTGIAHSLVEALHETQVTAVSERLREPAGRLAPGMIPILAEPIPPLSRAWRALLLGPILLRYDDPEAFAALAQQVESVGEELSESFGWLLELNSDYACIVRGGTLSAGSGPSLSPNSAQDQMILLLCTALRQQVEGGTWFPDTYGCLRLMRGDIEQLFADLRQRYGKNWGATVQQQKATDILDEMYQKMRLLGLLRGPDASGDLLILPTVARYAVRYVEAGDEEASEERPRAAKKSTKSREPSQKKKSPPQKQMTLLDGIETEK